MEKTITFNIPEGYVIDKENSTDTNIVLKLAESARVRTWEEYCEKMRGKTSYYPDKNYYTITSSHFGSMPIVSEFDNKEDTEAFAAYSKLFKLRKQWIGDWKPNWVNESQRKYVIFNYAGEVIRDISLSTAYCLSFPTLEMREEFFECFEDYLEQAKDLI